MLFRSPVIFMHAIATSASCPHSYDGSKTEHVLSQGRVDATLCSHGVRSGREELRYTSGVEASFGETEGCSQTSSTGADDNGIVFMIDDGIFLRNEPRSFFRFEVLGSEDASGRSRRRESP